MPSDVSSPIVANDNSIALAEGLDEAYDVTNQVKDGVRTYVSWRRAPAKTTHIRGDSVKASVGNCPKLMPPAIRNVRPTVTKHNQGPFTVAPDEDVDAIGPDDLFTRRARHGDS